ncbi:Ff.00g015860.m01.CDS01 [Fusarium sp. VM40]|nr:Ff.00g015860.m01.CDS01 [Fusarium sp. VM40]
MDGKILSDQQDHERQAYAYSSVVPEQAFQPQHLSPQPSFGQFRPPQAVSPETVSPGVFTQQHSPWLDPSSPHLREGPGYDRIHDSSRGLMGSDTYA